MFCKDPFLALYFSLSSSMISLLLCLLPSAALFTLTIWPFGPPPLGCCISPSSLVLSLLYKVFLRLLLTYASPGWFFFLSVINIIKLERLHWAASRAITGCLSFSPIPLLLSKASLSPLRHTLTHFVLSPSERALRLPTFFSISCLIRLRVKPRL